MGLEQPCELFCRFLSQTEQKLQSGLPRYTKVEVNQNNTNNNKSNNKEGRLQGDTEM